MSDEFFDYMLRRYTEADLERLLRFKLNKNLGEITRGGNLRQIVFDVMDDADRNGWIGELEKATEYRSSRGKAVPSDENRELAEIKFLLFGNDRMMQSGFVQRTSEQLERIIEQLKDFDRRLSIIEKKFGDSTLDNRTINNIGVRMLIGIFIFSAFGSLIAGVVSLWLQ